MESSKCDSVPIKMSILCVNTKVSSSSCLLAMLQQFTIRRDNLEA